MGRNNQRANTSVFFNPATCVGLVFWLDADDSSTRFQNANGTTPATAVSDPVGYWQNKASGQRHATQSTAANRPVVATNAASGRAVLSFDGSNNFLSAGTTSDWAFLHNGSRHEMFIVYSTATASTCGVIATGTTGVSTGFDFLAHNTFFRHGIISNSSGPNVADNSVTHESLTGLRLVRVSAFSSTATADRSTIRFNFQDRYRNNTQASAASTSTTSTHPLIIGARGGPNIPLNGTIAEVLIFNSAAVESELAGVEQYLRRKWNIAAPTAISSPLDISNCALWLDGADTRTMYTNAAGLVTPITSPLDIAGCAGWWDPSDTGSVTTVSGAVSQVNDKSGNNRHATQATPANRPTQLSFNGRSAMYFSGSNWLGAARPASGTHTIFAVVYATAIPASGASPLSIAATASFHPILGTGDMTWYSRSDGLYIGSSVPFGLSPCVVGWRNDSAAFIAFRNGVITTSGTASNAISTVANLVIGARVQNAGWVGYVGEVIVYGSALSTDDRARVEKYLANKWAINEVHDQPGIGQPVGYWGDKSGNSRHFTTTTTTRPALAATGRAGVVFNASPLLNTAPNLTVTAQTTVVVTSLENTVNQSRIFSQALANNTDWQPTGHYIPILRNLTNASISSWTDSNNRAVVSVSNNVGVVLASVHTGTAIVNYVNGVRSSSYTPAASLNLAVATMSLMGDQSGATTTNGRVSAVLVYNRALTAAEIASLTAHLSATYGLGVLPPVSGHPEVQDWINRVYRNGGSVSQYTADQVTAFAREIDAAGLRSLLYRVNLFCGNDINAAYVPLYRGPVALGTRFGNEIDVTTGSGVAFTYFENVGLQGDPVSNGGVSRRHLNTGVILGAVPQLVGNHHISAYTNSLPSRGDVTVGTPIGVYESASRGLTLSLTQEFYTVGAFANSQLTYTNATGSKAYPTDRGHYIANHISPILNIYEAGNKIGERDLTATFAITTPTAPPICVFAEGRIPTAGTALFNYTNPMQGYSIGAGLTAAQALSFSQIMERFQQRLSRGRLAVSA